MIGFTFAPAPLPFVVPVPEPLDSRSIQVFRAICPGSLDYLHLEGFQVAYAVRVVYQVRISPVDEEWLFFFSPNSLYISRYLANKILDFSCHEFLDQMEHASYIEDFDPLGLWPD